MDPDADHLIAVQSGLNLIKNHEYDLLSHEHFLRRKRACDECYLPSLTHHRARVYAYPLTSRPSSMPSKVGWKASRLKREPQPQSHLSTSLLMLDSNQ